MFTMKTSVSITLLLIIANFGNSFDYWSMREEFRAEETKFLGSAINLSKKEQKVNNILMNFKRKEYNKSNFLPSQHFFRSKAEIEKSGLFKFIQMVPKGASLHSHFSASLSLDRFLNLVYGYKDLYACIDDGSFRMRFFFGNRNDDCDWKEFKEWRQNTEFLKSQLSLIVDNPESTYRNVDAAWNKFEQIFTAIRPLFGYRIFVQDYIYQVLDEFYEDNVIYLEIRHSPSSTFDSNGTSYINVETTDYLSDSINKFKENYTDFLGLRFIYSTNRHLDNLTMQNKIQEFLLLQDQRPSMIAGFDLVGQEDKGFPLRQFTDQLLKIANKTKFFFHAGETNWFGDNLVDAVLLNTSRIGHGFAILRHPEVLKAVKEKEIAIEINPLSNQILKLVDDLRNHVGTSLIADGYPVVVTCDDPGFWGAKGLSYDWYMAFMGMTPEEGDLRVLKQFGLNSLRYSSLEGEDKLEALRVFDKKWNEFVDKVLEVY